jgi:hypothetical protein
VSTVLLLLLVLVPHLYTYIHIYIYIYYIFKGLLDCANPKVRNDRSPKVKHTAFHPAAGHGSCIIDDVPSDGDLYMNNPIPPSQKDAQGRIERGR